eukprot:90505_1
MSRFRDIMTALQSPHIAESQLLAVLSSLVEILALSTEETLPTFDSNEFAKVLVRLIDYPLNPEVSTLSARAITNMLEALPGSASIILDAEAVSVMCTKLKATDYTDLIEQILLCFSALSKSPGSGARVLQDGGLQPVLWFMEWFPITVQRNCVETAVNMVQRIQAKSHPTLLENAPAILTVLCKNVSDVKMSELCLTWLERVTTSMASCSEVASLESVASARLLDSVLLQLARCSDPSRSSARLSVLKMLESFARSSARLTEELMKMNIVDSLELCSQHATGEHMRTILAIANHLIPSPKRSKKPPHSTKAKFLHTHPRYLKSVCACLIPLFLRVSGASSDSGTRVRCLAGMLRVLSFADSAKLSEFLKSHKVGVFVVSLLKSDDDAFMSVAVQIASLLMQKLPKVYRACLIREGAVARISELVAERRALPAPRVDQPLDPALQKDFVAFGVELHQFLGSASRLLSTHFKNFDPCETDTYRKLTNIGASLNRLSSSEHDPQLHIKALTSLKEELMGGVTTYEFVNCGLVQALTRYLTIELPSPNHRVKRRMDALSHALLARHRAFVSVFAGLPAPLPPRAAQSENAPPLEVIAAVNSKSSAEKPTEKIEEAGMAKENPTESQVKPLKVLTELLMSTLEWVERFRLSIFQVSTSTTGSYATALRCLSQPLRLKLVFRPATDARRQRFRFAQRTVLIDCFATCMTMRNFVVQHVEYCQTPERILEDPSLRRQTRSMASQKEKRASKRHSGRSGSSGRAKSPTSSERFDFDTDVPIEMAFNIATPLDVRFKLNGHIIPDQMSILEAVRKFRKPLPPSSIFAHHPSSSSRFLAGLGPSSGLAGLSGGPPTTGGSPKRLSSIAQRRENFTNGIQMYRLWEHVHEVEFDVVPRVPPAAKLSPSTSSRPTADSVKLVPTKPKGAKLVFPIGSQFGGSRALLNDCAVRAAGVVTGTGQWDSGTGAESTTGGTAKRSARPAVSRVTKDRASSPSRTAKKSGSKSKSSKRKSSTSSKCSTKPPISSSILTRSSSASMRRSRQSQRKSSSTRKSSKMSVPSSPSVNTRSRRKTAPPSAPKRGSTASSHRSSRRKLSPVKSSRGSRRSSTTSSRSQRTTIKTVSSSPSSSSSVTKTTADQVLPLLRFINCLAREWRTLFEGAEPVTPADLSKPDPPLLPPSLFQCKKITHKVSKQLLDPLAVCSDSIPSWVAELITNYPFLFPFETREFYFRLVAFGRARALATLYEHLTKQGHCHGLESTNAFSLSGQGHTRPEDRVPQVKLSVRRGQVLDNAMEAFEVHSASRGSMRAEFTGEAGAGVGQGPTLEFFTLLSHEIQRRDLSLWRDEDPVPDPEHKSDSGSAASRKPRRRGRKRKGRGGRKEEAPAAKKQKIDDFRHDQWVPSLDPTSAALPSHTFDDGTAALSDHGGMSAGGSASDSDSGAGSVSTSAGGSGSRRPAKAFPTDFHQAAVLQCAACDWVEVPSCEEHGRLMSSHSPDSDTWHCPTSDCNESTSTGRPCPFCNKSLLLRQWCFSDEEADFLSSSWPRRIAVMPLILLQCAHCLCVNFPGTAHALCVNRNGKITSMTGSAMSERSYRYVTRHLTDRCAKRPLQSVAIMINKENAEKLSRFSKTTPYLHSFDEVLESSLARPRDVEYVACATGGLFPRPLGAPAWNTVQAGRKRPAVGSAKLAGGARKRKRNEPVDPRQFEDPVRSIAHWEFLGRLLAQAVMDSRLLDMPFSSTFFKVLVGHRVSLGDLLPLDFTLGRSMISLSAAGERFKQVGGGSEAESRPEFQIDSCPISDLGLDFTLPGAPAVRLRPAGKEYADAVTLSNVSEYAGTVARYILVDGVAPQFTAIRRGFQEACAIQLDRLPVSSAELMAMVCGTDSSAAKWDFSMVTLQEVTLCEQGYTHMSCAVQLLFEILEQFDAHYQRLFVRFVTGCPRLPVQGLRALRPRLTIIRIPLKTSGAQQLPSAMTCTNYLKLPDYDDIDVMREKLCFAMKEGQSGFQLS